MRAKVFVCAVMMLLFSMQSASARSIPTFRGFPVYPPQEIDYIDVPDEGDVTFSLALNSREDMLEQLDALDPLVAKVQDTKKITLEFDVAKSYIQRNAALLGWQIIRIDETWGKDSQEMVFVRKKRPSSEVKVVIWTGSISITYEGIVVKPPDMWGMITYSFFETAK